MSGLSRGVWLEHLRGLHLNDASPDCTTAAIPRIFTFHTWNLKARISEAHPMFAWLGGPNPFTLGPCRIISLTTFFSFTTVHSLRILNSPVHILNSLQPLNPKQSLMSLEAQLPSGLNPPRGLGFRV